MRLRDHTLTELHDELFAFARTVRVRIGSTSTSSVARQQDPTTEMRPNSRMDVAKRTPSVSTNPDGSIWNDHGRRNERNLMNRLGEILPTGQRPRDGPLFPSDKTGWHLDRYVSKRQAYALH